MALKPLKSGVEHRGTYFVEASRYLENKMGLLMQFKIEAEDYQK